MTPIEKNIIVVDEQGREYGATYPKRAKGLVKNGRARFVDENKICLACPPDTLLNETEDIKMSENINTVENMNNSQVNVNQVSYSIEYILKKIYEIQSETSYLNSAIEQLTFMGDGDSGACGAPGNLQGQAKANAIGDIVRCRETTNQQILKLYEKMYDDIVKSRKTFNEAQELIDFMLNLQNKEGISEDIYNSVVDPLISTFQGNLINMYESKGTASKSIQRIDDTIEYLKTLNRENFSDEAWSMLMSALQLRLMGEC